MDLFIDVCIYYHTLKQRRVADCPQQDAHFYDILHDVAMKVGVV